MSAAAAAATAAKRARLLRLDSSRQSAGPVVRYTFVRVRGRANRVVFSFNYVYRWHAIFALAIVVAIIREIYRKRRPPVPRISSAAPRVVYSMPKSK